MPPSAKSGSRLAFVIGAAAIGVSAVAYGVLATMPGPDRPEALASPGDVAARPPEARPRTGDCRWTLDEMMTWSAAWRQGIRDAQLVPGRPDVATVCRFRRVAGNESAGSLIDSGRIENPTGLADVLNRLREVRLQVRIVTRGPTPSPSRPGKDPACFAARSPLDVIVFRYSSGDVRVIDVTHGCLVSGNGRAAEPDAALRSRLDALLH